MTADFHTLRVRETREEIGGRAKSITLDVPVDLKETFAWRPGQHVTVRFGLNGEDIRRSYSISSSPFSDDGLRITVKRVKDGLVSNHINDTVDAGDTLDVMSPFGGFCLDPGDTQRRTYYFFGAGSGITPIYAMLQSALIAEPHSVSHLVYGNIDAERILFRNDLELMQAAFENRFTVSHVLSDASFWSSFRPWRAGRIDKEVVAAAIDENPPYAQDVQYYICGPGTMNAAVKTALAELDVPPSRIHLEHYGGDVDADLSVTGMAASAEVELDGRQEVIEVCAGQTILEALLAAGHQPPYSCQSGVCGACRARLHDGDVHMRARMALEEKDIAAGDILTCQAVPTEPKIALSYR